MIHVWVELLACEEFFFLRCAFFVAGDCGTPLDAMDLDGLFALEDGRFVVAFAQACSCLVRTDVHGEHLVEVVFVAFVLSLPSLEVCHLPIVKRVVVGSQGVVGTRGGCVFLD